MERLHDRMMILSLKSWLGLLKLARLGSCWNTSLLRINPLVPAPPQLTIVFVLLQTNHNIGPPSSAFPGLDGVGLSWSLSFLGHRGIEQAVGGGGFGAEYWEDIRSRILGGH